MTLYYRLADIDDGDAPSADMLFEHSYDLEDKIWEAGEIAQWEILKFALDGTAPRDYMVSDAGFRLYSGRLANILSENAGAHDEFQFLRVDVLNPHDDMAYPYYVLHFIERHDVLDAEETATAADGRMIIKPVLQESKVAQHHVFGFANGGEIVFVSENVKKLIEDTGCTGLEFTRERTTPR